MRWIGPNGNNYWGRPWPATGCSAVEEEQEEELRISEIKCNCITERFELTCMVLVQCRIKLIIVIICRITDKQN